MQIHEITKLPVNEGIASALGSIVGGARAGASALGQKLTGGGAFSAAMKDPVRQQQIKMLADKTYDAWKAYEKDLLKANPDAREGDMYEQALLAFVSKNLLGGQYLPNVINQSQIKALVKQLSQSGATAKTPAGADTTPPTTDQAKAAPGQMPASVASSAQGQRMQQAYGQPRGGIQGMQSDLEEVTMGLPLGNLQQYKDTSNPVKSAPNSTPTAGASLSPAQIPGKSALLKGKGKSPQPPQPAPTTAVTPTPAPATMSPQKEKDLWLKLIQQAAIAQTQAPGTQTQSGAKPSANTQSAQSAGDARSYQQQLTQSMDAAVVKGLPMFGNTAVKNIGDNNVQSTGNPVADALLLMAGFRGI
jgi:hypothetical protein